MKNSFGICLRIPRNQVRSIQGRVIIIIMEKYVEWINASIYLNSSALYIQLFAQFFAISHEKYKLIFDPPPFHLSIKNYYGNDRFCNRGRKNYFSTLWRIESPHPGYVNEIVIFDVGRQCQRNIYTLTIIMDWNVKVTMKFKFFAFQQTRSSLMHVNKKTKNTAIPSSPRV